MAVETKQAMIVLEPVNFLILVRSNSGCNFRAKNKSASSNSPIHFFAILQLKVFLNNYEHLMVRRQK